MNEIIKPAAVLLIITAVAAMLLGIVSESTKEAIAAQTAKTQQEAMQAVMPEADSFEPVEGEFNGTVSAVNKAMKGSDLCGYVINVAPGGFGGPVGTMVGIDTEGTITGLRVLSHAETPGLGALATDPSFYEQFNGKSGTVAVTKDGGEIVPITSATITSRAVSDGATEALNWFAENGGGQ